VISLSRKYVGVGGAPEISQVSPWLFIEMVSSSCVGCGRCCSNGCDVEFPALGKILNLAESIQGFDYDLWFETPCLDLEFPGGGFVRASVQNGTCVFQRDGKCVLHSFSGCKPLVCRLFPITFDLGILKVAADIPCRGLEVSVYARAQQDLLSIFGRDLIQELDRFCVSVLRSVKKC